MHSKHACAQGVLSVALKSTYYDLAQRHAEVPRLSALQRESLAAVGALALGDGLRLDFALQPGDLQLLSNRTMLHTRSAFTDAQVPARRRARGGASGSWFPRGAAWRGCCRRRMHADLHAALAPRPPAPPLAFMGGSYQLGACSN